MENLNITVNPLDTTAPILTEVTPINSPTVDHTPSYTFNSNEAGSITYGGACGNGNSLLVEMAGNKTITYNTLADGTYSNCSITVTDASGNVSTPLNVHSFTVQTSSSSTLRGDVDQNGLMNTTDAQLVLRKSLGLDMSQTNWYDSVETGDANCDGMINTTDAMLILRNSLGLDMSQTAWCL